MSNRVSISSDSSSEGEQQHERIRQAQTPGLEEAQKDYFFDDDRHADIVKTFTRDEDRPALAHLASLLTHNIATKESNARTSTLDRKDTLAGIEQDDPVLNPSSPEFDFYKWVRMFMRQMETDGIKHRRAGFTFKNLTVTGTGSSIHLQQDLSDIILLPIRLFQRGAKSQEKKILRNFNGVLKDGEMLIVLGKPG